MSLGLLTLELEIPGCRSLKEKRSRLRPLLARLGREFNVSAAELGQMDAWAQAQIGCALLSNDAAYTQRALQSVAAWVETHWPDVQVAAVHIELVL